MSNSTYASVSIDKDGDPRSAAVIIATFLGQESAEVDDFLCGDGSYFVDNWDVPWGRHQDFPDAVARSLRADDLPLVAFDWNQEGYCETPSWSVRVRPTLDGLAYEASESSTVDGEEFIGQGDLFAYMSQVTTLGELGRLLRKEHWNKFGALP